MHALIIEEDSWITLMIEDVLRELGYTSFAFASSVEAAVAAAEERCPDLITSDVRLASGNGIEAVQRICSAKPIPVVFVTDAPREAELHRRAAVVAKPFCTGALKEGVTRATGPWPA